MTTFYVLTISVFKLFIPLSFIIFLKQLLYEDNLLKTYLMEFYNILIFHISIIKGYYVTF